VKYPEILALAAAAATATAADDTCLSVSPTSVQRPRDARPAHISTAHPHQLSAGGARVMQMHKRIYLAVS